MRGAIWAVLLGLIGLVGCGGGNAPTSDSGDGGVVDSSSSEGIKTRELSDLPAVDDPLPVADQGRVQISLPTGWKTLQKNPKFLVACVPEDISAASLPRVSVSVSDPPVGATARTTAENAQELADKLAAQLRKEEKFAIESPRPIILGSNVWVRHVRKSKYKDDPVAVQYLQTVQSGRLYSVDLTVTAKDNPKSSQQPIFYDKTLPAHRDFAYAVAGTMKFPKEAGGSSEPPPPAEDKPADKPAEPEKSE